MTIRRIQRRVVSLMLAAACIICATVIAVPARAAVTLVPLGNLLDDAQPSSFTGNELAAAIATDTYAAAANTTSYGVAALLDSAHQTAPLNAAVTIAPGEMFNYTSVGGGTTYARQIRNDAWGDPQPIRTTGTSAGYNAGGGKIEDGLGMHANSLITYRLTDLQAGGAPSGVASLFSAYFDQNDDQATAGSQYRGSVVVSDAFGNVIAGYVNGQAVAVTNSGGVWSFTGTIPSTHGGASPTGINFNVGLPSNAAYITLATTSTNVTSAHAVWSGASINYSAKIQLGNLFDDTQPTTPTGTELWSALATDTYKATADASDVGVDLHHEGGLNAAQSINSGGVQFNFTNVGGGSPNSNSPANDSIGGDLNSRPPLRLDGTAAGFPIRPVTGTWGPKVDDGIGMHANSFLTFNLDEIRADGGLGDATFQFQAKAGLNDSAIQNGRTNPINTIVLLSDDAGVIAGYVNGVLYDVSETAGVWTFDASHALALNNTNSSAIYNVFIGSNVKYLTLVGVAGSDINAAHIAFVNANLYTFVPTPAALPAGLALLGAIGLRRRRRVG